MNVDEVDARLAQWQSDVEKLHKNLLELQDNISFLDGRELSGVTLERQLKARQAESRLWIYVDLYIKLVEEIKSKRAALPLPSFGRGKALEEIEQLFSGPSIELPGEEVALADRGLFSDSQRVKRMSVSELRRTMETDFQVLRDFHVQAQQAWEAGGTAIIEAEREVAALTAEASQYGRENADEIAQLRGRLLSTTKRWRADPLGVPRNIGQDLEPYIRAARAFIGKLKGERARLASEVGLLGARLEEVKLRRVIALQKHQACSERFDSQEAARKPPSTRVLADNLEALKTLLAAQKWPQVESGLADWHKLFREVGGEIEAVISFNQALLQKLDQLTRRYNEALAKYDSYISQGMQAAKSVNVFTEKGHQLLEGKVKIDEAELIVSALEVKVGELCASFDKLSRKASEPGGMK